MPRKARIVVPGLPLHVIVRGVNREPIFCREQDYRYYLGKLKEALHRHGCALHAYVLMTNHAHLLMTPADEQGPGKTLQTLGRCYVQYFNYMYGRTGTLWEGRYRASLVDTETYLLACYRYIEMNPLRAKLADHLADYPWSSFRHNALGQTNPIITPHPLYLELGQDDAARQLAYRSLFREHIPEQQISEIRRAANKEWILGSSSFKDKIARHLKRQVRPLPRGGDRKSKGYRETRQSIDTDPFDSL